MQKFLMIIGAALLLGGVTAAGTFASLGSGSDDNPSLSTEPIAATTTTTSTSASGANDVRREDRRQDRAAEARGRANEPGEDLRGHEAEPNDDRGREAEPNDDRGGAAEDNSGPSSDSGGHSGHGGGGDDD